MEVESTENIINPNVANSDSTRNQMVSNYTIITEKDEEFVSYDDDGNKEGLHDINSESDFTIYSEPMSETVVHLSNQYNIFLLDIIYNNFITNKFINDSTIDCISDIIDDLRKKQYRCNKGHLLFILD